MRQFIGELAKAAVATVITLLVIIILLYAFDISIDSNIIYILIGLWAITAAGASLYFTGGIGIGGGASYLPALPPAVNSVRVNITQLGTAYTMPMNCAPNNNGTTIDCVTDADFLKNQIRFTDVIGALPGIGGILKAVTGIVTLGTEVIEKLNDIPIGTTETLVKSKVSDGIDTITSTIAQPINNIYNEYNKPTTKSITP